MSISSIALVVAALVMALTIAAIMHNNSRRRMERDEYEVGSDDGDDLIESDAEYERQQAARFAAQQASAVVPLSSASATPHVERRRHVTQGSTNAANRDSDENRIASANHVALYSALATPHTNASSSSSSCSSSSSDGGSSSSSSSCD